MSDKVEKVKQAKEAAEKIADKANEAKEAAETTWPEVANNALEGLQTGFGEVADVVGNIAKELREAAPEIWHGLVEYHRWLAIGDLIVHAIYYVLCFFMIKYGIKWFLKAKAEGQANLDINNEWNGSAILQSIIAGFMFAFGVCFILGSLSGIPKLIGNAVVPERAAAIEIIKVIKSGGKIEEIDH